MDVIERKPIPFYVKECYECKSKIKYYRSEVHYLSITCPVCKCTNDVCMLNIAGYDDIEE